MNTTTDQRGQELTAPKVQFKGIRDGILVTFGEGTWPELREALFQLLEEQGEFLRGARLALDVGSNILRAAELGSLRDTLSDRGMGLWAVLSSSPTTESTAQTLGLATRISKPKPQERTRPTNDPSIQGGEGGILVRRTIRSGFSLHHPGHIIVIGDVNPGAEITAGGDVIVWGRLRGTVHAGAEGDENCVVCALDMSPTHLRISGHIYTVPQRRGKPMPETVRLQGGQFVVEQWNPKSKELSDGSKTLWMKPKNKKST